MRDAPRMTCHRIVTDLRSATPATTAAFYRQVLGLEVAMDLGWIATLVDPENPSVQLSLIAQDATAPEVPSASVEVGDVDAAYRAALAANAEIVHPLTDEPWGVRRFFLRDPDGHVINVMAHRPR